MKILHDDGSLVSFRGAKLDDIKGFKNRFLCQLKNSAVMIAFDEAKNHRYWSCSCGGRTVPYHTCDHLKNLEIHSDQPNAFQVLDETEFKHYEKTVLNEVLDVFAGPKKYQFKCPSCQKIFKSDKSFAACPSCPMAEVQFHEYVPDLIPPFCTNCGKKLPINSGHCPCGRTDGIYEHQLQELGLSVGLNQAAFKYEEDVMMLEDENGNKTIPFSSLFHSKDSAPIPVYTCDACGSYSSSSVGFHEVEVGGVIPLLYCAYCYSKKNKKPKKTAHHLPLPDEPGLPTGVEPWELCCNDWTDDPKSEYCLNCGYWSEAHSQQKAMQKLGFSVPTKPHKLAQKKKKPEDTSVIPVTKAKRKFADKDEDV